MSVFVAVNDHNLLRQNITIVTLTTEFLLQLMLVPYCNKKVLADEINHSS